MLLSMFYLHIHIINSLVTLQINLSEICSCWPLNNAVAQTVFSCQWLYSPRSSTQLGLDLFMRNSFCQTVVMLFLLKAQKFEPWILELFTLQNLKCYYNKIESKVKISIFMQTYSIHFAGQFLLRQEKLAQKWRRSKCIVLRIKIKLNMCTKNICFKFDVSLRFWRVIILK